MIYLYKPYGFLNICMCVYMYVYCFPLYALFRVPPLAQAANAFDEWHIAFHGTAAKNVKKILDTGCLVLPGQPISLMYMYNNILSMLL